MPEEHGKTYAEVLKETASPQTREEKAAPPPLEVKSTVSDVAEGEENTKVQVVPEDQASEYLEEEAGNEETSGSEPEKKMKKKKRSEKVQDTVQAKSASMLDCLKNWIIPLDIFGVGAISAYVLQKRQAGTLTKQVLFTCTALTGALMATSYIVKKSHIPANSPKRKSGGRK
ncbi:hypothetical protein SJAG_04072 [Schizosaccharomyces japonicus yFS275]|uniref:Uncharacterized protein n=1 Tax=Schizosaccharomyces japonicus (strain yFS275 / FY16936) TaxID=402676 RepID=B6K5U6_SCHJY|nr:hypothetical protein SJAG_04072 [Schizosaccharomyces japonicus yFS275]EEB08900.1 hypothetical protein SJAG_04072 [Schizosaccharomyces japonicus yFS275]